MRHGNKRKKHQTHTCQTRDRVDSYQRQKDQLMKDITNMNQHIEDIEDTNYKRHIDNKHPSKSSKKL
jgi:hypothetical protein